MKVIKNSNSNDNFKNDHKMKYIKLNPIVTKRRVTRPNREVIKTQTENNIEFFLSQIKRKSDLNLASRNFNEYTENLEKSMNGYQMSYSKENEEDDPEGGNLNKYIKKVDKELFRKIHFFNNSNGNINKNLSSKNSHIKIGVEQMEFPNPMKSLGIIRNNQNIFSVLNKNNLTRQSESFNKQIEEINHINLKYAKKMPRVHITDILLKEPTNIPVINMAKKKKSLNLETVLEKAKKT